MWFFNKWNHRFVCLLWRESINTHFENYRGIHTTIFSLSLHWTCSRPNLLSNLGVYFWHALAREKKCDISLLKEHWRKWTVFAHCYIPAVVIKEEVDHEHLSGSLKPLYTDVSCWTRGIISWERNMHVSCVTTRIQGCLSHVCSETHTLHVNWWHIWLSTRLNHLIFHWMKNKIYFWYALLQSPDISLNP